jgi:hypothetical protein
MAGMDEPILDIITKQVTYLHVSLPDARRLIFDISECRFVAVTPNPDHTLAAYKTDGQIVVLEPIKRME